MVHQDKEGIPVPLQFASFLLTISLGPSSLIYTTMPGCTLSEHQKKQKACEMIKERSEKAVLAYLAEQQKEPCLCKGLQVIAELHGIDHNKLAHAVKGG